MNKSFLHKLSYLITVVAMLSFATACEEEETFQWAQGTPPSTETPGNGNNEGDNGGDNGENNENNNGGENTGNNSGGDNVGSVVSNAYTRRLETPALKGGNYFIYHNTKVGTDSVMTYCYEYDPQKQHSRWIAFRFDSKTRTKNVSRTDAWSDDPKLPSHCHIGTRGFSGYDRGHICASADRLYSRNANEQTFYMSNMSPQLSKFNQNYWVTFEGHVQELGRNSSFADTLYVVKGGTIEDNQILTYVERDNGTRVAVPQYYFMALLKVKNNVYTAIAFWADHKANTKNATISDMQKAAITIDELEKKTGIDFFHNLPDAAESVVESQITLSAWNL